MKAIWCITFRGEASFNEGHMVWDGSWGVAE